MAIFTERKIKNSILVTLTLLFLAIGVIPLAVSSFILIRNNREGLQTNLQESFFSISTSVSGRISSYIDNYRYQIHELIPKASEFVRNLDAPSVRAEMPTFLKDLNMIKAAVYAPSGRGPRAKRPEFDDRSVMNEEEKAFNIAIQGKSFISDPYYIAEDNTAVILIAEPLKDASDNIIGVLSVIVSADPLFQILNDESVGAINVYVVDRAGKLILSPKKQDMQQRRDLSKTAIVSDFIRTQGRVSTVRLYEEKQGNKTLEVLGSNSAVKDVGWGVIVQIERDVAFASVGHMIRSSVGLSILFALLAAVVGFLFARWITQPIQQLAQHALDVGRNQTFDKKIEMKASNEIQQLADTFNYMTDEVKQNILGLQAAARENKELFMSSIRMLAAAIDAKDPYTRGHSERVKDYTMVIGRSLGFSAAELERLEIAALLHDVGKIGIDDRILRKPTNLTPDEFEIMKTHPDKGAAILAQIEQLRDIIPGMRAHHENYDGSGYPQGLKGEDIPLFGRVITVADTFDAMTTDRPYQKAFTLEFALNRIRTMANVKYDPKIVDSFGRACEEGKVTLHKPSRPRPRQPVA
jgi:HD-GYP domain-containing protein (c-di-GMP phosphodiesterase class II)